MYTEKETGDKPPSSRRPWRRSRISIPDRTSSLCHRPTKTQPKPRHKSKRPDSISLHNRSCKLFSSIDEILALTRETPPPTYSESNSRPRSRQSSNVVGYTTPEQAPVTIVDVFSTSWLLPASAPASRRDSGFAEGQTNTPRPSFNNVMSWTSDETRRREYEKIDRAHSGWRGFLNSVKPKSWRNARRNFFHTENEDEDDADSVRRFRVSLPEKSVKSKKSRKWTCFH